MKTTLIILFTGFTISIFAQRQNTEYFTKEIYISTMFNDTTVFLYEKGNYIQPRVMLGHGVKNPKALYENIAILLEKEFPIKPDSKTINMIKNIQLDLVYNGKGEIRFYSFRMSSTTYNGIPDLERKLYHFITAFKAKGMLNYDISSEGAPLDSCSFAGSGFRPAIKYMWQSKE